MSKNILLLMFVCTLWVCSLGSDDAFAKGVYYDFSTDPNLGDHCFVWDQWPGWATYNDWKKIGTTGYGSVYLLTTDVNIVADEVPHDPAPADTIRYLNWTVPLNVAPTLSTTAGYEWSVPLTGPGSDQIIVGFKMAYGMWNFDPGAGSPAEFQLTDDKGNVLWRYDNAGRPDQWMPVQIASFAQYNGNLKTVRLVMKTVGEPHWAWAGNSSYLSTIVFYTVDEPTPAPAFVPDHNGPYYGFMHVATGYGNHISKVAGFTNLNDIFFNEAEADSFIANGSRLLVNTTWTFWNSGVVGLRSDYQQQWDSYKARLIPYKDYIGGFYLMDEPELHGWTPADISTATAVLKADFPDIPVMVCFAGSSLSGFTSSNIPSNVDWVAFDHYGAFSDIGTMLAKLKSIKHANQKIFLVPQGYTEGYDSTLSDQALANRSVQYDNLYHSDPEIIGQLVYLSPGAREAVYPTEPAIPLTSAAQQTIGSHIVGNGQCGDLFHRNYKQTDFNADCYVNFADFAAIANSWMTDYRP